MLQMTNTYGSPSLDELEAVSQEVSYQLDSLLGPEDAGTIEVMLSSPVCCLSSQSRVSTRLSVNAGPLKICFICTVRMWTRVCTGQVSG